MGTETIAVYFKPLASIGGLTYYHETLVYTNAQGQTFYTHLIYGNKKI